MQLESLSRLAALTSVENETPRQSPSRLAALTSVENETLRRWERQENLHLTSEAQRQNLIFST